VSLPTEPDGPPGAELLRAVRSGATAVVLVDAAGHVLQLDAPARTASAHGMAGVLGRPLPSLGPGEPWVAAARLSRRVRETRTPAALFVADETEGASWELSASLLSSLGSDGDRVVVAVRYQPASGPGPAAPRQGQRQALAAFAEGVASASRNPLFNLSATVDAFEARFGKLEGHPRYVSVLRGELRRLTDLLDDLLEYAIPRESPQEACPFDAILAQAIAHNQIAARRARVTVVSPARADIGVVRADRRRLVAALGHLVENAVRHSPRGERVHVEAGRAKTEAGPLVECSIRDGGPGFRPEDLPRVFEPFFARQRGRASLTLAIVERAIEAHGGRVWVENVPGGGVVTSVRLPLVVQDLDAVSRG
jgi:signal transduction histidine kinase